MSGYLAFFLNSTCKEHRLGHKWDGGWTICLNPDAAIGGTRERPNITTADIAGVLPMARCLVYSFGIRASSPSSWSFDKASKDLGCEVHSFDPTIGVTPPFQPAGVNFHPIGIASRDNEAIKVKERADKHGGVGKMHTLSTIRRKPGHDGQQITLLKMDVEGQEWGILRAMVNSGVAAHVGQILIEFHFWGAECLLHLDHFFTGRKRSAQEYEAACKESPPSKAELAEWSSVLHGLQRLGFYFQKIRANPHSNTFRNTVASGAPEITSLRDSRVLCCYEVVLTRRRRAAHSVL